MPFEKIGYRRLYDSIGCSIASGVTIHEVFPFEGHFQVEINIGSTPKFGIHLEKDHDEYLVPGTSASLGSYSYHFDVAQSGYPRAFFTEIIVSRQVEVSAKLSKAFHREEAAANTEMLALAGKYKDEFSSIADAISGSFGLRFHRQFVIKLLNENFVAYREVNPATDMAGSPIQILETPQLTEVGIANVKQLLLTSSKHEMKVLQSQAKILGWLMRAWIERDAVSKFNALFIPLEMILDGIKGEISEELRLQIEEIQELIATYGGKQKAELQTCLDILFIAKSPSLVDRFTAFAKEANMPGWKDDVEAFKRFHKVRNNLVHRGDAKVKLHVPINTQELQALEDLTEKYVNYALFGDTAVYQTQWRAKLPIKATSR